MIKDKIYHVYYINNFITTVIRGAANYFSKQLFNRVNSVVISTYNKGIQHLLQKRKEGGERYEHPGVSMILDPSLEFEPDPLAGRFLWQYPSFAGSMGADYYIPKIYADENVEISLVFGRYIGRFDLIIYTGSQYETIDAQYLLLQTFGGVERPSYKFDLLSYLIIPDEFILYSGTNPYTNITYSLNWDDNTSIRKTLIKNINTEKWVYPFVFPLLLRLNSISDGSEKYGGTDKDPIGTNRLTASFTWEANVPSFMIFRTNEQPENDITSHSRITLEFEPEYFVFANDKKIIIPGVRIMISGDESEMGDYFYYKERFLYKIKEEDKEKINNNINFIVDIPTTNNYLIEHSDYIEIYGKYGLMDRNYHWRYIGENKIEFYSVNMNRLEVDDSLWIVVYDKKPKYE